MTPPEFIDLIRRTFGRYPDFSGGCLKFHVLMLRAFPEGEGYYDSSHVITLIDGKYWDIDGEYTKDRSNFIPIRIKKGQGFGYKFMVRTFAGYLGTADIQLLKKHYKK